MKLNLSKADEANKAEVYFAKLIKDGAKIELKKISPPRSINQNSYLHVLFQLWGNHFGYSCDDSKQIVKVELDYTYEIDYDYNGVGGLVLLKQTSKMNKSELTEFIDKFRNWSADNGCWLPSAEDYKLRHFDYSREAERAEIQEKKYSY